MISFFLLMIGLLLIFLEFYLPGAILGIIGGVMIVLSIILFAIQTQSVWGVIFYSVASIALLLILVKFAIWKIKRNKEGEGIYLGADQEGYVAVSFAKELIGKHGIALTDLRPSGFVLIEEKRLQAVAKVGFIDKESQVTVVGGEGGHLIVTKDIQ